MKKTASHNVPHLFCMILVLLNVLASGFTFASSESPSSELVINHSDMMSALDIDASTAKSHCDMSSDSCCKQTCQNMGSTCQSVFTMVLSYDSSSFALISSFVPFRQSHTQSLYFDLLAPPPKS